MPRPIRAAFKIPYGAAFGAVRAGGKRKHEGTDYHCPIGTPIYGTADGGRVTSIGFNGDPKLGLGHNIQVTYPGGVVTLDAHMRERTRLNKGDYVGTNTVIGYVGLTGNAVNADPPGSHDHHQRWHNSVLVNPESVYASSPASTATPIPIEEDDMYSDEDRARDAATAERTRQIEAALTGKINGAPVGLNPDVNFGQSLMYGLQEARKGIQKTIDTPNGIDVARLADLIASKLPVGSVSEADITAAVIAAAPAIGKAARAAIIKE